MSGIYQIPKELSILRREDFILNCTEPNHTQLFYLTPQFLYKHGNMDYETLFKLLCRIK